MRSVIKTLWEATKIILHLHRWRVAYHKFAVKSSWRIEVDAGYTMGGTYWLRGNALSLAANSPFANPRVYFDPEHNGTEQWPTTATEN